MLHYGLFAEKKVVRRGGLELQGPYERAYKIPFISPFSTPMETLGQGEISSISQVLKPLNPLLGSQ